MQNLIGEREDARFKAWAAENGWDPESRWRYYDEWREWLKTQPADTMTFEKALRAILN